MNTFNPRPSIRHDLFFAIWIHVQGALKVTNNFGKKDDHVFQQLSSQAVTDPLFGKTTRLIVDSCLETNPWQKSHLPGWQIAASEFSSVLHSGAFLSLVPRWRSKDGCCYGPRAKKESLLKMPGVHERKHWSSSMAALASIRLPTAAEHDSSTSRRNDDISLSFCSYRTHYTHHDKLLEGYYSKLHPIPTVVSLIQVRKKWRLHSGFLSPNPLFLSFPESVFLRSLLAQHYTLCIQSRSCATWA